MVARQLEGRSGRRRLPEGVEVENDVSAHRPDPPPRHSSAAHVAELRVVASGVEPDALDVDHRADAALGIPHRQLVVGLKSRVVVRHDVRGGEPARNQPRGFVAQRSISRRKLVAADRGLVGRGHQHRVVGRESRQISLPVERNQVAEMGVLGVERVVRAEGVAPAGRDVAVRHAHLVGESGSERNLVQPLAETDPLNVGDAAVLPFDLAQIGNHAVGVVPARREGELARVITPLEIERQRGRQPHGVIFVGSRTALVDRIALPVAAGQRVEELVAAVGGVQVETHAQSEIAHAQIHERAFVPVPAVGGVGLGARKQVLRDQRKAHIEVDHVFVDRRKGVERHGHPAVGVHQIGHLAIPLRAELAGLSDRIGARIAHRVEVHHVPAFAGRVHQVDGQPRRRDGNQQAVIGGDPLLRDAVAEAVVGRQQHPSVRRGGREGAVGRGGDAVFAAGHQVVTVGLVPARGDRAVIELAAPGPQVRKGDVGPLGNRMQAVGVDAADPHAAVVRDEDVPRHRTIVPRQSVNLRPDGRFEPPFGTLAVPHHDRITAVGIVLDPSELLARSRGIERVSLPFRRAGHTVGEVHITQLRVDALFEKRGTAVLGPPDAAVGHRRTGRDQPRMADRPFPARTAVDHDETRNAVEVGFQRHDGRVAQRQGPLVGRVVLFGQRGERHGAVPGFRQRIPVAFQFVEGFAEELHDVGLVEFAQRHARGGQHVGVARPVPRDLVPDVLAVAFPGVGADLIAQLVVVGNVVAVGAAEPAVDVAAVAADAAHGAVGHRKRRLETAAERRVHRFGHHGVALHGPDRHAQQTDGRPLLSEHVTQGADDAPVEVVVLHGVAVLVGHELLVPRHRIAVDGGRGEEFHALGKVHHQSVRLEILGMHDEGNAHRAVAESVTDVGPDRADVEQRAPGDAGDRIGIDHPHVGRADRRPLLRRVRTPGVILGRGAFGTAQRAQQRQEEKQPAHVTNRLFCSGSRCG